jgi:hypothetical protein
MREVRINARSARQTTKEIARRNLARGRRTKQLETPSYRDVSFRHYPRRIGQNIFNRSSGIQAALPERNSPDRQVLLDSSGNKREGTWKTNNVRVQRVSCGGMTEQR